MTRRVGAYAKLLANYASDDAIIAAGEAAELLFVRGLAFCATSDSDGYITEGQLVRVVGAGMKDAKKRAGVLVREGLWQQAEDGYVVRSWLKIHEAAEEKGRKRRTDRERKRRGDAPESARIPSGTDTDSERNPDGVPPDSLLCSYVSSSGSTEQSTTVQSSARIPAESPTAQTIVAEWIERTPKRPPGQVVGQVAKLVGQMLAEGVDGDDIRRGLSAWMSKGLHPSTLPSVVNEVMNAPVSRGRRTADDKVRDGLDLARRLAAEEQTAARLGITA